VFDGLEPGFVGRRWTVAGVGFAFEDLRPFGEVLPLLGEAGAEVAAALDPPRGELGGWTGTQGLSAYVALVPGFVVLASFGEFQPARYCVFVDGVWRRVG